MAKRKQTVRGLPGANSAATPPGPWSVVTWSAVEPQRQTVAEARPSHRRRKGPVPGTVSRYREADHKLYPELEQLAVPEKRGSISAAARHLAEEGKVAGAGTAESRARRLATRYLRDIENSRWRAG